MAAKSMVCTGVRRRIGNGKDTRIWDHPWLQDEQDPMIQTEMPPQLANARVFGLIDQDTETWDTSILTDIFVPEDVPRIMKIPVSPEYEDMWYWHDDPRGLYSVKSGYKCIVGRYDNTITPFNKWQVLWKLKIPPKWKTFLWRALSDILPTTMNLRNKRVDIEPNCAMCGMINEDTMHALVTCDYAKAVWGQASLPIPVVQTNIFNEWFNIILDNLNTDGLVYAAAILYHIWRARNNAVWDAYMPMPKKTLRTTTITMQAWCAVHRGTECNATPSHTNAVTATPAVHPVPLHPPGQLTRRCYVDASYHHATNTASVGAVLLDGNGQYISAYVSSLPSCFSSLMAEAFTCKEALSWLKNRGEESLELLMDCLTVEQYLTTSAHTDRSYVGYAIDGCRNLINSLHSCLVVFVPRSKNYLAHALANSVISQTSAMYWDTNPSAQISHYFE
ncbi:PREDICTED: uncharacterized protein LOC109180209 [Ipomoea nil]|uniref:uncharacterized protein LOC109180209 n=1 Tax=Ipomoea nil TaxID=35883 RepID=UPI0009011278|nr:PREDICTED: uncharacterized protein LOC109180209 [Ipomoea nil]